MLEPPATGGIMATVSPSLRFVFTPLRASMSTPFNAITRELLTFPVEVLINVRLKSSPYSPVILSTNASTVGSEMSNACSRVPVVSRMLPRKWTVIFNVFTPRRFLCSVCQLVITQRAWRLQACLARSSLSARSTPGASAQVAPSSRLSAPL